MAKNRPFRTRYSQRYDAWEGLSDPRKLALSTPRGGFLQPRYAAKETGVE